MDYMDIYTVSIKLRDLTEADRLFMEIYKETDCVVPVELTEPDSDGMRTFKVHVCDNRASLKHIRQGVAACYFLRELGFDHNISMTRVTSADELIRMMRPEY